jgi:hypothetical protein
MTFTINSNQRDLVRVRLNPGETVRWEDGRPFRMREGSWLTVIMSADGTAPACLLRATRLTTCHMRGASSPASSGAISPQCARSSGQGCKTAP